jgi:prolipoprotein diacylglyceryltransferase
VLFHIGDVAVLTHPFFVTMGILTGTAVVVVEAIRRRQMHLETLVVMTGAAVFGAIGMRLSGIAPHLDPSQNPTLAQAWNEGSHSVLGGLAAAYLGAVVAKKLIRYKVRTGDLFAPAVALGMAVGRIGCLLTEAPGRPTSLPWGIHAPATVLDCPGCVAGVAMHPSFAYEIIFQLGMFVALCWLRGRITAPGELLTIYICSYAVFRFAVEFTRASETVWLGLTRPQWFLIPGLILVGWRVVRQYRHGVYDGVLPWRTARAAA